MDNAEKVRALLMCAGPCDCEFDVAAHLLPEDDSDDDGDGEVDRSRAKITMTFHLLRGAKGTRAVRSFCSADCALAYLFTIKTAPSEPILLLTVPPDADAFEMVDNLIEQMRIRFRQEGHAHGHS